MEKSTGFQPPQEFECQLHARVVLKGNPLHRAGTVYRIEHYSPFQVWVEWDPLPRRGTVPAAQSGWRCGYAASQLEEASRYGLT